MHKFKFEPPQEHRRSLQQPKNQYVPLITLLEKCTQILREDRLWLRNEIKNCNPEVLDIFKQYPKAAQTQSLQIKLRKYVQTVKSQLKAEQLSKFKDTLALNATHNLQENRKIPPLPPSSHHHASISKASYSKAAPSLQVTAKNRNTRSQEHFKTASHLNMNNSLRHFQDLLKYKGTQEIIEERESQNVTSARLARQEQENQKIKPLQEQSYQESQNRKESRSQYDHLFIKTTKNQDRYGFRAQDWKQTHEGESNMIKSTPWDFQKRAKEVLYQNRAVEAATNKQNQQNVQMKVSHLIQQKEDPFKIEERSNSIFDKHFTQSNKMSLQLESNSQLSPFMNEFDNINPSSLMKKSTASSKVLKSDIIEPKEKEETKKQVIVEKKDEEFTFQENLYTPLDLLNECRSFLKNRDSKYKYTGLPQLEEKEAKSFVIPSEIIDQPMLNRNRPSLTKEVEVPIKEEESELFPCIKDSDTKKKESSNKKTEDEHQYAYFETFANSSSEKKPTFLSKLPNCLSSNLILKPYTPQKLSINFNLESTIDDLMELASMSPFITVKDLTRYVNNHPSSSCLKTVLKKYLAMSSDDQICITNIAGVINQVYNMDNGLEYPHNDKTVNCVYDLLDIDAKGYVTRSDIESFLSQIEDADIDNFDEVTDELWGLFQGADFNNDSKLSYWHFYLVKNSDQFQRVNHLLGQFEFEIERSN